MSVYEQTFREIGQLDPLIRSGGILTVGLESIPESDQGVRWSLPLAKFRYYGDPVIATRMLSSRNSRISFQELVCVVLGCLSNTWPELDAENINICSYYSFLWKNTKLLFSTGDMDTRNKSWLKYLGKVSRTYLDSSGEERESMKRLINFGRRRCASFLNSQGHPISFEAQTLNLTKPETFIRAVKLNWRLEYLRRVVKTFDGRNEDWIIVYRDGMNNFAFVTALPSNGCPSRQQDGPSHCRWQNSYHIQGEVEEDHESIGMWIVSHNVDVSISCLGLKRPADDEFAIRYHPRSVMQNGRRKFYLNFKPIFGDLRSAILCWNSSGRSTSLPKVNIPDFISNEEILAAMRRQELNDVPDLPHVDGWKPLQAIGAIGKLYNLLGTPNISMDITSSPLESMEWIKYSEKTSLSWYHPLPITREAAFSCIVLLETGNQDLDPKLLSSVFAVSVGDSIYAAAPLVHDPYEHLKDFDICRAPGNIGKAGVSLIVPPAQPKIRPFRNNEWNLAPHDLWDGKPQNSFANTSLHLSLTEYRVPYTTEHEGARDIVAFFQEAVISVYDKGIWVGDVDILKALSKTAPSFMRASKQCSHGAQGESLTINKNGIITRTPRKDSAQQVTITSIDNWHELLDKSTLSNPAVVRSHQNWLGRLAAASLSSQLGYCTLVLPDSDCEKGCFSNIDFVKQWIPEDTDVVIF